MSKFQVQAHELVMSRDQKKAFADSFIFEPENIEEQALGNLYVVGEVTNFSESSSYLINLLISIVKREYYSNFRRSPLDSLEAALHKANSTLADFAEQGNIEWINNLNITIAVLKDQELHFGQTGHCCVLLVRNKEIANINQGLPPEQTSSHLKTFANIASGQIEAGDQLIFATESFLDIISETEIKNISELNFEEKIKKLENIVKANKDLAGSASVIILKISEEPKTAEKFNRIRIAENIKAPFGIDEEKIPDLILKKSFGENADNYRAAENSDLSDDLYEIEGEGKLSGAKKIAIKIIKLLKIAAAGLLKYSKIAILKIREILKTKIIPGFKKLAKLAAEIVLKLFGKIKERYGAKKEADVFSALKEDGAPEIVIAEIKEEKKEEKTFKFAETEKSGETKMEFSADAPVFKKSLAPSWPNKSYFLSFINIKNILATLIVVLIIFTASIVVVVKDQKSEERNFTLYRERLKEAVQKKEAAELAFIVKEDVKAKAFLKEAKKSLDKIFVSGYFREETTKEISFINNVIEKLDKINIIAEPAVASDLAAINAKAELNNLLAVDNNIYLFGSANNAIYAYDMLKGASSRINVNSANVGNFIDGAVTADKKIIIYHNAPGLAIFNPNKSELSPADISLPKNNPAIKDIIAFDAYFYLLDSANGQIVKYKRTTGGFADGKDWIVDKGGNDLAKAVSFAVDGSLYILDDNGKIYKYYGGAPKEFNQYPLFDFIGAGGKIITRANLKNLFVLDPANKRIVIFDKEGNLVKQIKSEKFDALKDMAIIDEKTAYILNGTKIFKVGL